MNNNEIKQADKEKNELYLKYLNGKITLKEYVEKTNKLFLKKEK